MSDSGNYQTLNLIFVFSITISILFLEKNRFQLSNNRFVSISDFRGKIRVDIREYYVTDDGQRKPGRKGISLSLQEWAKLKDYIDEIEKAIKNEDSDKSESDSNSE